MRIEGLAVHRSGERTAGDRGLALGRAQREAIANTVAVYRRLFSEDVGLDEGEVLRRGEEVGRRVGALRPDLVDEIAGIAAGAGEPVALMLAVNARTELLAGGALASGGAECSVAGSVADGCVLAQNWDFHPDLARSRLLWTVESPGVGWFATFTEAGIVAKSGLNAAGVAVTLNFLASDADGGTHGLPVHVLLRMLLDGCEDGEAARELISGATPSASACITVAAAAPEGPCALASYELSPRGVRTVAPDSRGRLVHTNHFLGDVPVRDLALDGTGASSTLSRLQQVRSGLDRLEPGEELDGLGELLSSWDGPDPVFRHAAPDEPWLERCATLATLVYDVAARRMWIRVAPDPVAPLVEVPLPVGTRGAAAERPRPS